MQRKTNQRDAILQVFEEARGPLNPQQVLEAAGRYAQGLGIATVYRTLRALVERGHLTAVQIPGEPSRYERCGKGHHHYFRCRTCAQVFNIEGCPGNFAALVPRGFRLEDHELVLHGLCAGCAKKRT